MFCEQGVPITIGYDLSVSCFTKTYKTYLQSKPIFILGKRLTNNYLSKSFLSHHILNQESNLLDTFKSSVERKCGLIDYYAQVKRHVKRDLECLQNKGVRRCTQPVKNLNSACLCEAGSHFGQVRRLWPFTCF